MLFKMLLWHTVWVLLLFCVNHIYSEKPCAPRAYPKQSVVCVCNSTYCDTITGETLAINRYVAYTSNAAGLRFYKTGGELQQYTEDCSTQNCPKSAVILTINPSIKYQVMEGFGGAVTDAAAINWNNLSDPQLKQLLVDSYFSESGIEYNMIRVPIGGSDFSTHAYSYNDQPEDDINLDNFNLTDEDYNYKIPMIQAMMQTSPTTVHVLGTTWSPPIWMKTRKQWSGYSKLKPEYFQTYALYHYKFIDSYTNQGVPIWGITTTNEPINGVLIAPKINCMGWSPNDMGKWIAQNLGPTLRNSTYKDVKILAVDDQRISIPYFFNLMVKEHKECLQYIDGVAVHFYSDAVVPAAVLSVVTKYYPDKFILATEACEGTFPWQEHVVLGSWDRAASYIHDIITDLNHQLVGWIDWNMCLNEMGGPNYVNNFADSPIIVYPEKGEFVKQPMFYAMGHFSKFIPRGSQRIDVVETKSFFSKYLENVAVITPDNTIVIVLHNNHKQARVVKIRLSDKQIVLNLSAHSVTTVKMPLLKEIR